MRSALVPGASGALVLLPRRFQRPGQSAGVVGGEVDGAGSVLLAMDRDVGDDDALAQGGDLGVEMLQPAIWLRRENVLRCGGPDPAFHYYFDMEMYIRYFALYPRIVYAPATIAAFRVHAASKTASRPEAFCAEYRRALEKLSRLEGFEALWTPCRRRLQELDRHLVVARILADAGASRWWRTLELLALAPRRPRPRMLRILAAAIRGLLRNQPWITPSEE